MTEFAKSLVLAIAPVLVSEALATYRWRAERRDECREQFHARYNAAVDSE